MTEETVSAPYWTAGSWRLAAGRKQQAASSRQLAASCLLLDTALGSRREIQSLLYVALDHAYANQNKFDEAYRQADVVGQLINMAMNTLDRQITNRSSGKTGPRRKPR